MKKTIFIFLPLFYLLSSYSVFASNRVSKLPNNLKNRLTSAFETARKAAFQRAQDKIKPEGLTSDVLRAAEAEVAAWQRAFFRKGRAVKTPSGASQVEYYYAKGETSLVIKKSKYMQAVSTKRGKEKAGSTGDGNLVIEYSLRKSHQPPDTEVPIARLIRRTESENYSSTFDNANSYRSFEAASASHINEESLTFWKDVFTQAFANKKKLLQR